MNSTQWNPGTLLETSGYYWKTCTLHAGVKLNIFTIINQKSLSADDICKKIHADPKGIFVLLNALSSMGLITKTGDLYSKMGKWDRALKSYYMAEKLVNKFNNPTIMGHVNVGKSVVFSRCELLSEADGKAGLDYLTLMNANVDRLAKALTEL